MPEVKESQASPPAPFRTRKNLKTTGKTTVSTMRGLTSKNSKHVEEFSSGESVVVREEGKLLRVEEDSKVMRGNSLVRKGRRRRRRRDKMCKSLSD